MEAVTAFKLEEMFVTIPNYDASREIDFCHCQVKNENAVLLVVDDSVCPSSSDVLIGNLQHIFDLLFQVALC